MVEGENTYSRRTDDCVRATLHCSKVMRTVSGSLYDSTSNPEPLIFAEYVFRVT